MKANRIELLTACEHALKGVDRSPVKKALGNLLCDFGEGTVTGTDLELAAVGTFKAEGTGRMIFSCGKEQKRNGDTNEKEVRTRVVEALREMPDETVTFHTEGREITSKSYTLRGASSEFEFTGEDPSEFPAVSIPEQEVATIDGLSSLVKRVLFCVNKDFKVDRFAATSGVLVDCSFESVSIVGTNGRQLAVATATTPSKLSGGFILPPKALTMIPNEPVTIYADKMSAALVWSSGRVITRLVEGRFPQYQMVIPKDQDTVTLQAETFARLLRQADIFADRDGKLHIVELTIGDGKILIASKSQSGRANVQMLPVEYDGTTVAVKVDPRHLCQALETIDGDVSLGFKNATEALTLRADGYTVVTVPLMENT